MIRNRRASQEGRSSEDAGRPVRLVGKSQTGTIGKSSAAPSRRRGAHLAPWRERAAKQLLLDQFAEAADIGAIARSIGISRGHFIDTFASAVGMSPYRWLVHRRLERAAELLVESDLALAEVALECGFYDQSHFNRTFVRWIGTSPGRWRTLARLAR